MWRGENKRWLTKSPYVDQISAPWGRKEKREIRTRKVFIIALTRTNGKPFKNPIAPNPPPLTPRPNRIWGIKACSGRQLINIRFLPMSFFGVVKGMCGVGGGLKVRTHYYEKSVCRERYERSHVIARGGGMRDLPPPSTPVLSRHHPETRFLISFWRLQSMSSRSTLQRPAWVILDDSFGRRAIGDESRVYPELQGQ